MKEGERRESTDLIGAVGLQIGTNRSHFLRRDGSDLKGRRCEIG